MQGKPMIQSPHVYDPFQPLSEGGRRSRYHDRIDMSIDPYTVIDVLQKVFHRSFERDLLMGIFDHPEGFKVSSTDWKISSIRVEYFQFIRPESVFFQNISDFQVDIFSKASILIEEERCEKTSHEGILPEKFIQSENDLNRNQYGISRLFRLRYSFDLRPCHMKCRFVGVVLDDREKLIEKNPNNIPVDKYLLPVLHGSDYDRMARYLIQASMGEHSEHGATADPNLWAAGAGLTVKYGIFQEDNILGEYFFDYGLADIVDLPTGNQRKEEIAPGTIILNERIASNESYRKTTLAHELTHHYLGRLFFLLQKMHGYRFSSYLCKREYGQNDRQRSKCEKKKWTPIEILEMQANKMPGHLLINSENGQYQARKIMVEHQGRRDIDSMSSMVDAMAGYFGTTKTVARTRLMDFGYAEARGLMRSANGELIPAYISTLKDHETYTIDEADGIREYIRNRDFRNVIDSGRFLYVEGHYCLADRKYIYTDRFGMQHLTLYAREHMEECCLVFERIHPKSVFQTLNGFLHKGVGKGRQEIQYCKKDGTSAVTEEGRQRMAMIRQQWADKALVEMDFNQMLVELMNQRNMNIGQLAEATGLSRETIKRMRNDRERVFQVQDIVAVSIALSLPPEVSRQLLNRAPCGFLNTDEMHAYQYMMTEGYLKTVPEVNRMLVEMGLRPLTNLVEGFDENGVMEEDCRSFIHCSKTE